MSVIADQSMRGLIAELDQLHCQVLLVRSDTARCRCEALSRWIVCYIVALLGPKSSMSAAIAHGEDKRVTEIPCSSRTCSACMLQLRSVARGICRGELMNTIGGAFCALTERVLDLSAFCRVVF